MPDSTQSLRSFRLPPGRILGGKYTVEEMIGGGWEGEVYKVVESKTGITRAAKLFYPARNPKEKTATRYARKLERLRSCPMVIQYHHSESVRIRRARVTCLISEFVEGELLSELTRKQAGRRLPAFEALHILHRLAEGLESIHAAGEYHGDLHAGNVLVRRSGISFDLKVLDFFYHGRMSKAAEQMDVIDAIRLFYDALGGRKRYAANPAEVKWICCGLRHDLITKKFPTASRLRLHLESFEWSGA